MDSKNEAQAVSDGEMDNLLRLIEASIEWSETIGEESWFNAAELHTMSKGAISVADAEFIAAMTPVAAYGLVNAARAAVLSAPPAVQVPQDAALQFADHIINGAFDGGDWNGGDLQDLAADYGLLKLEEMAAPCSEEEQGCRCARDGADFPVCCFRKTYRLPTPTANPSEGAGE